MTLILRGGEGFNFRSVTFYSTWVEERLLVANMEKTMKGVTTWD